MSVNDVEMGGNTLPPTSDVNNDNNSISSNNSEDPMIEETSPNTTAETSTTEESNEIHIKSIVSQEPSSPLITPLSRRKRIVIVGDTEKHSEQQADKSTDEANSEESTTGSTATVTTPATKKTRNQTTVKIATPNKPSKGELLLTPSQAKELSQKNKRWIYVPVTETVPIQEQPLPAKRERKQVHLNDYIFPSSRKKGEKDSSITTTTTAAIVSSPISPPPAVTPTKEEKPTRSSRRSTSSTNNTTTTTTPAPSTKKTPSRSSSRKSTTTATAHSTNTHIETELSPEKVDISKLQETIIGLQDELKHVKEQMQSTSPKILTQPTTPTTKAPSSSTNANRLAPPPQKFSSLYSDDEDEMEVEPPVAVQYTNNNNNNNSTEVDEEEEEVEITTPAKSQRKRKSVSSVTPPIQSRSKPTVKKPRASTSLPNTPVTKPLSFSNIPSERAQRSTKGRRRFGDQVSLVGPMKRCLEILDYLMNHQLSYPFLVAVDPIALNILDYFTVIKHPMDFGTIRNSLLDGVYETPEDFAADCRLVFSNAMLYNPPANQVHVMAKTLEDLFDKKFAKALAEPPSPEPIPEESEKIKRLTMEMKHMTKELEKMKKESGGGRGRYQREELRPMSLEEKTHLGAAINALPSENLPTLIQVISHTLDQSTAQEEIEIDLERLDTGTLRRLEKFVISCFPPGHYYQLSQPHTMQPSAAQQQKQREIENVTKQINQLNRGLNSKKKHNISKPITNAHGRKIAPPPKREEEVVVDDTEKTNYPPVLIEKDLGDDISSGSGSSDSESDSSDSDSSSSYSESEYSDSENDQSSHRSNHNNSNNSNNNFANGVTSNTNLKSTSSSSSSSSLTSSSSSTTIMQTTTTSSSSVTTTTTASSPAPQIIQSAKKTNLPTTVASWNFDSSSTSTSTEHAASPISSSTSLPPVSSSTPPIVPQSSPLSPHSPTIPSNSPTSPSHQSNANNSTDSTWAHFKAKNMTLQQKEKEKVEQAELLRKEKEDREEEARREEERRKQELLEAQKKQKEKLEAEAEEAKKQLEASRIAAREAREKASGKSNMSFQYQMDMMATFENSFSSNMDNPLLNLQFKPIEDSFDSPAIKE